ncbi:MAG: TIGR04282 family arsenosugar biosynthesis glycosyltransferase [Candidatus Thermoplasmatota archaeon]|nr:TIGR04282 family arsenosugar biosynthesis glycosyltransferase [Candidatus Thermoplasmatota archaeon]
MRDNCLILMVRSPRKGNVKSRLAREIGDDSALEIYRRSAVDILRSLEGMDADILIGYHPRTDLDMVKDWLGQDRSFLAQSGLDLGARQANLIDQAFSKGYRRASVMISDSPDIPPEYIREAFLLLDAADAVIGPCHDGGYYLIGFRKGAYNDTIFNDMDWSNEMVSRRMMERMTGSGISFAVLRKWWDIDVLQDLIDLRDRAMGTGHRGKTLSFLETSGVLDGL